MTLNKRERLIAIAVALSLAIFLGDRFLLTPYLDQRDQLVSQIKVLQQKVSNDERLLANRSRVEDAWRSMLRNGLDTDASNAASRTMAALFDWSQAARFNLQAVKPDHVTQVGDFQQIRFQASGTGNMSSISRLIWSIETSGLPLQINEIRMNSQKDGVDDIALQISVSSLVLNPQTDKNTRTASAAKGEPS